MRTKICLNCRFFVITRFLQFRSCKCFSSLIVINREENSMLLEQLNYRDPGSNQGPLDLQSYALPTELSLLEELLPTSEWFSNFCQNFFYFYIIKPHGRLKTRTLTFILDLNNTVGIFSGKRRTTGSVFYLRLMFLLAPNCKLLKISWVKIRTKICLNCRFFMKTHLLQFKSSKCFSSLIVINREENSTLLEQLNCCRDPGSNQGPLDLQSYDLPTELSRLEELLPTSEGFSNFCQNFFDFYIIKPHGRLKTSTVIFILDLNNTVGIFSGKRRTTGSVFYLRLMFLLAPNCKLLKISWVKIRTKICLNCHFFYKNTFVAV